MRGTAPADVREWSDTNIVPTEGWSSVIRVWADGCTDNDGSQTTPANANGQNDAVRSTVKTNNAPLDLTNPVILSTSTYDQVPSGVYTSKTLRVWFNIPARVLIADTLTLRYNIGAGDVVVFTHAGTAALDHNNGTFTFDISALTVAECQALVFRAQYLAAVVVLPETVINLDAVAIDLGFAL